ncbi:hypothetical protein NO1_0301 [Candidatus Termititenax aidoneus]|uniref:Uncharacterized protein n=1 Tax=Termititenax aidoneus TaxID=2218524 RepID=A0A388T9F5_TERA1|nr:hypothetical protein NO1_0301 [Candidatus Termititenax aidoneus]
MSGIIDNTRLDPRAALPAGSNSSPTENPKAAAIVDSILSRIDKSVRDWNPFTSPKSVGQQVSNELTALVQNDRKTYNEVIRLLHSPQLKRSNAIVEFLNNLGLKLGYPNFG